MAALFRKDRQYQSYYTSTRCEKALNIKDFKMASLNVCGQRKKAEYPDFLEFIENYDLLFFSETKIDETDVISFPGYSCFAQPRKSRSFRRSGGISVYFRDSYAKYIKKIESESDYILWMEIDKSLFHTDESLIFGSVYIPPENSNYYNDDEMFVLENEITSFCSAHKYVCVSGDYNARTSENRDYTENDDFLAELFNFDEETSEFFSYATKLPSLGASVKRHSQDKSIIIINNNGSKLIDMCKNNNFFMLNGRYGGDRGLGKYTFRQTSVIDYTLVTLDIFSLLRNFDVLETDPIFSDGHCILSCVLSCFDIRPNNVPVVSRQTHPKWNDKYAHAFINHIDRDEISALLNILESGEPSRDSINEVTDTISNIFLWACSETFPPLHKNEPSRIKPWFGPCCKTARRKYHLARKCYNKKNEHNRAHLVTCSREYKKTMNKFSAKYKKHTQNKLRNL